MAWWRTVRAAAARILVTRRGQLLWNGATGCLLLAASDAVAQQLEHRTLLSTGLDGRHRLEGGCTDAPSRPVPARPFVLDRRRATTAGLVGAVLGGAVYPVAYARLEAAFPGRRFRQVLRKSVVEVLTVGVFVNSLSLLFRGLLVGRPPAAAAAHAAGELPRVTAADAAVWLPYNLLAFAWIPLPLRPTAAAGMEAGWQTFLSLRAHDYAPEPSSSTANV